LKALPACGISLALTDIPLEGEGKGFCADGMSPAFLDKGGGGEGELSPASATRLAQKKVKVLHFCDIFRKNFFGMLLQDFFECKYTETCGLLKRRISGTILDFFEHFGDSFTNSSTHAVSSLHTYICSASAIHSSQRF
jgi:hypothetical protein